MQQSITKWIGMYINVMAHIAPGYAGKFGFRIFGRPARRRIKPAERRFLNSSVKFTFEHKGILIRGYRWGNGKKKILLLHGWQSHSAIWKPLVESLPETEYTLYAFDAPGHGRSGGNFLSAPLYGDVILHAAENLGRFHAVVAHSLGAFSALYVLSSLNGLETNRMVVLASPGEVSDFVEYLRDRLGLDRKALAAIRVYFKKKFGRPYEDFSVSRFGENLKLPGLIIHDKTDRFAPVRYAKILNRKWKNAELIITDGLGHNLYSTHVLNDVIRFVNGRSDAGKPAGSPKTRKNKPIQ